LSNRAESGARSTADQLADRLITAEQDERRRIALFLHDGPVQSLAGIALMLDAAVDAIGDGRLEDATRVLDSAREPHRDADIDFGEKLAESAQVALYQVIREALSQAARRGPPSRISVRIAEQADGSVETVVEDDGAGERRRASAEAIEERALPLGGRVSLEQGDAGGTVVTVLLPEYTARR